MFVESLVRAANPSVVHLVFVHLSAGRENVLTNRGLGK
jgi:hypothetical protein